MSNDKNPNAVITKDHLLRALDWADNSRANARDKYRGAVAALNGYRAVYQQDTWGNTEEPECGTACCVHGAAHLLARGEVAGAGPQPGDYEDMNYIARAATILLMTDGESEPKQMRAAALIDCSTTKSIVESFNRLEDAGLWRGWIVNNVLGAARVSERTEIAIAMLQTDLDLEELLKMFDRHKPTTATHELARDLVLRGAATMPMMRAALRNAEIDQANFDAFTGHEVATLARAYLNAQATGDAAAIEAARERLDAIVAAVLS